MTKKIWKILLLLVLVISCAKDEEVIPNVSFSGKVYIPYLTSNPIIVKRDVENYRLGINGVLIYYAGTNEYYAFDLMCPYEKSTSCMVSITDGATCTCPCCGSRFIIVTNPGSVVEGPSQWPLKSYNTHVSIDGDYLYISN